MRKGNRKIKSIPCTPVRVTYFGKNTSGGGLNAQTYMLYPYFMSNESVGILITASYNQFPESTFYIIWYANIHPPGMLFSAVLQMPVEATLYILLR